MTGVEDLSRLLREASPVLDPGAVGLTAAVSGHLANVGISRNVVAAFHHDPIFVPIAESDRALAALTALSAQS
jgi:hypothetical protein